MNSALVPIGSRALFFDAVGTLIHPEPEAIDVYYEISQRYRCHLDRNTIAQRFRHAFDEEERRDAAAHWRVSEERERQRWSAIVRAVFVESSDPDSLFDELWHHFSRPEAWRLADDAPEVLAVARRIGLTVGVASNFDSRLHRIMNGWEVLSQVPHRIISSEVGWRKPSEEFFRVVVRTADCAAHQIVFVGDRPDTDVAGAQVAGLVPILMVHRRPTAPIERTIVRLRELLEPT